MRPVCGWAIWVHFPGKCPQLALPAQEWELRGRCPWKGGLSEGDALLGWAPKEGMEDPLMGKSRAQVPQPHSHVLCPSDLLCSYCVWGGRPRQGPRLSGRGQGAGPALQAWRNMHTLLQRIQTPPLPLQPGLSPVGLASPPGTHVNLTLRVYNLNSASLPACTSSPVGTCPSSQALGPGAAVPPPDL